MSAGPDEPVTMSFAEPSALRILVVEDNALERSVLCARLARLGYQAKTASDGREALELLRQLRMDLIVSDWQMPEMNGPELCQAIRAQESFGQPYFVLLTGRSDPEDLVTGMDAGADDFLTKPASSEELRVRLKAASRLISLRRAVEVRKDQLEAALEREQEVRRGLQADIEAADRIQRQFLPARSAVPSSIDAAWLYLPSHSVSGDALGLHDLGNGHVAFFVADVCGHGVPAAMQTLSIIRRLSPFPADQSLLVDAVERTVPRAPQDVVAQLNRQFCGSSDLMQTFTLVYGVMNLKTGEGSLVQAGAPHPLCLRGDGRPEPLGRGGLPLGMFEDAQHESVPFKLRPGECLLIYTDGIDDRLGEPDAEVRARWLARQLADGAEGTLEARVHRLGRELLATSAGGNVDDMSALVIGRRGTAATQTIRWSIPDTADAVAGMVDELAAFLRAAGRDEAECFQLGVCAAELLNNIVEHGSPPEGEEAIRIDCRAGSRAVWLRIRDAGADLPEVPSADAVNDLESLRGRGWAIARAWSTAVRVRRVGAQNVHVLVRCTENS